MLPCSSFSSVLSHVILRSLAFIAMARHGKYISVCKIMHLTKLFTWEEAHRQMQIDTKSESCRHGTSLLQEDLLT